MELNPRRMGRPSVPSQAGFKAASGHHDRVSEMPDDVRRKGQRLRFGSQCPHRRLRKLIRRSILQSGNRRSGANVQRPQAVGAECMGVTQLTVQLSLTLTIRFAPTIV